MARRTPSQLNMLLAVDKPVGCTSHDVVSKCRRALHERRVGHAGTLDPMASGVMVVGVGQATRLLGMLTLDTKSYVADISFAPRPIPMMRRARRSARWLLPTSSAILPMPVSAWPLCWVRRCRCRRRFGYLGQWRSRLQVCSRGQCGGPTSAPVEVYAADLIAVGGEGDTCVWTVAFSVSKGTISVRSLAIWAAPARAPRTFPRCAARRPVLFPLALVMRSRSFLPSPRLALPWIPLRPWAHAC